MRIEKISENQIKFLLSKSDLTERNIKINELAYGSEKIQELFREMMEQALAECGFEAENTPLMIEAIPMSAESIMIIVTKVSGTEVTQNKYNVMPRSKEQSKLRKRGLPAERTRSGDKSSIYIYSFDKIDNVIDVSGRLLLNFNGESSIYKYNGMYYLIMENPGHFYGIQDFEPILSEYGQKHISDIITKYYLLEHGEPLIESSAVQILAGI